MTEKDNKEMIERIKRVGKEEDKGLSEDEENYWHKIKKILKWMLVGLGSIVGFIFVVVGSKYEDVDKYWGELKNITWEAEAKEGKGGKEIVISELGLIRDKYKELLQEIEKNGKKEEYFEYYVTKERKLLFDRVEKYLVLEETE